MASSTDDLLTITGVARSRILAAATRSEPLNEETFSLGVRPPREAPPRFGAMGMPHRQTRMGMGISEIGWLSPPGAAEWASAQYWLNVSSANQVLPQFAHLDVSLTRSLMALRRSLGDC